MSLALASRRAAISPAWVKNPLWRTARAVPSLDLPFADIKSLVDAVTGQSLVTFTRASSGTYVDSTGTLRTATTNLLLRSEEFNDAAWTKNNLQAFGSGSVANATIAPNGTLTADKLVENTATAQHMVYQNTTPEIGKAYVLTFYAKAAERTFVTAAFSGGGLPSDCRFGVNLNTGEIVSGSTSGSPELTQVTPIGDGWYRIALIKTMPAASVVQPRILMSTNGTAQTYLGDGTSGIFLWGAQLEQSSTVGEYIPTTSTINSAPRFDHNPTTGESLGLLVEEQRTNLLLRSEEFDNASWAKENSSIGANVVTAPNGSLTADKLIENTANAAHIVLAGASALTAGQPYVISVYLKAAERTFASIGSVTSGTGTGINLSTGALVDVTVPGWTNAATRSVTNIGNGWYRVAVTVPSATGNNSLFDSIRIFTNNGTATVYTGDGTSGIFIWGAQLEAGAFPTSYIPTTTAAATRSADVASITGSNFSSWYRQDEGTVFAEAISPATSTTVFAVSDGSTNNRIQIETGSNTRRFRITSSGTARYDNSVSYALGTSGKSVGAYIVSGSNHATNGVLGVDLAGSPLPVVDRLLIGTNGAGVFYNNGTIRRLTYWPARLPNSTLQAITQ